MLRKINRIGREEAETLQIETNSGKGKLEESAHMA
jgi:hypothetical protein